MALELRAGASIGLRRDALARTVRDTQAKEIARDRHQVYFWGKQRHVLFAIVSLSVMILPCSGVPQVLTEPLLAGAKLPRSFTGLRTRRIGWKLIKVYSSAGIYVLNARPVASPDSTIRYLDFF